MPSSLKPALTGALVALGVVALAALTNPSPQSHRERIKQAVAERSPVAGALGIGALTAFVSSYHSIGVASYTVVNDRTVTVGAFGIVFLLPERPRG